MKKAILMLMVVLGMVLVMAESEAPQGISPGVNNSFPKLNDTINFTLVLQDNFLVSHYIFGWDGSGVLANDSSVNTSNRCLQEDYDNLTCGSTAHSIVNEYGENPSNFDDNDFDSFANTGGGTKNIYLNLSNSLADEIYWEIKGNDLTVQNLTETVGCYNRNKSLFDMRMTGFGGGTVDFSCKNDTSDDYTKLKTTTGGSAIYELQYHWIFHYNQTNISVVKNLDNTSDRDEITWQVHIADVNGNVNVSTHTLQIEKIPPVASVSIENQPLSTNDALNASITFEDNESDTWQDNETRWYNGSTILEDVANFTILESNYTDNGQTWIFSARVYDGFNWSDWANDTVIINDTSAPTINSFSVSSTSVNTDQTLTFSINVTDPESPIESNACTIGLHQSGLAQEDFNLTTSTVSGDIVSRSFSDLNDGTLEWRYLWCDDASSNRAENLSVGINITITDPPASSGGGGGGGGGSSSSTGDCSLDLFSPREGGKIQMAAGSGVLAVSQEFLIRNVGDSSFSAFFQVDGNQYLEDNCKFQNSSLDLPPNLLVGNRISCLVGENSEEGRVKVVGCGEGNYELVVNQNAFLGIISSILNGEDVTIFSRTFNPYLFAATAIILIIFAIFLSTSVFGLVFRGAS